MSRGLCMCLTVTLVARQCHRRNCQPSPASVQKTSAPSFQESSTDSAWIASCQRFLHTQRVQGLTQTLDHLPLWAEAPPILGGYPKPPNPKGDTECRTKLESQALSPNPKPENLDTWRYDSLMMIRNPKECYWYLFGLLQD